MRVHDETMGAPDASRDGVRYGGQSERHTGMGGRFLSGLVLVVLFTSLAAGMAVSAEPPGEMVEQPRGQDPAPGLLRVRWLPWERPSFELAASLKRPIMLYLRAEDCRLCRGQERDLLTGQEVIRWIRDQAVPVAVDVDLRPAVAARYVSGLVPSLLFLLPNGEPIYDVEKASSLHRVGGFFTDVAEFTRYLRETAAYFHAHSVELVRKAAEVSKVEAKVRSYPPGEPPLARFPELLDAIRAGFDFKYGGFGRRLKSIQESPYVLFTTLQDEVLRKAVLTTADHLLASPMHDSVEGGFHHYATSRDWSVPALEKRLEVNARAIRMLVEAATLAPSRTDLKKAVEQTAAFLVEHLALPGGGFALSQHGSLGPDDPGTYFTSSEAERARLRPPPLNRQVVASANALAGVALMQAGALLKNADLEAAGLRVADFLAGHLYARGRGLSHFVDESGKARRPGLLVDQVAGLEVFLTAYQVRGRRRDLDIARDLLAFCTANLEPHETYFVDQVPNRLAVGLMRRPLVPVEANGQMALLAFKMAGLTGDDRYTQVGLAALGSLATALPRMGPRNASYALALKAAREGPVIRVLIRDRKQSPGTDQEEDRLSRALRRAALLLPLAGVVSHVLQAEESASGGSDRSPGGEQAGQAGAYVCHGQQCVGPFTRSPDLLPAARALLSRNAQGGKAGVQN